MADGQKPGVRLRVGGTLKIGGVELVLVAKAELERLLAASKGVVGEGWLKAAEGKTGGDAGSEQQRRLFKARREAGLTQSALAKRLGKSQTLVSQAEAGRSRVSGRYVESVLQACGLSAKWGTAKTKVRPQTGWDIPKAEWAGLDPETFVPVRRGSRRDKQLKRRYVWWGAAVKW